MENWNISWVDCLLIYLGFAGVALSIGTFIFGVFCTALSTTREFPTAPILVFWLVVLLSVVLSLQFEAVTGCLLFMIGAPVNVVMLSIGVSQQRVINKQNQGPKRPNRKSKTVNNNGDF